MTPEDHNDIIDRAALISWIGLISLLGVFFLAVIFALFFDLAGTTFVLAIIIAVLAVIAGVFAVFWATYSFTSISIFRLLTFLFALATSAIAIFLFVQYIIQLRGDNNGDTGIALFIDVIRETFIVLAGFLFAGLMIAYYVTATHYASSLERRDLIKTLPLEPSPPFVHDVESPEPTAPPMLSSVRQRFGQAIDVNKGIKEK